MNGVIHKISCSLLKAGNFLHKTLIKPHSEIEDDSRRERILNILLLATIILLIALDVFVLYSTLSKGSQYRGIPFWIFTSLLLLFSIFLSLSRSGRIKIASYGLISFYFISVTYASFIWGVRLPNALIGYAFVIIISGILLGTKKLVYTTGLVCLTLIALTYSENRGFHTIHTYWKIEGAQIKEAVQFSLMYIFIMIVVWLSNKEIEDSLFRARSSEQQLKQERDMLEVRVAERTQEIKNKDFETIAQLYKFAEFGKLSSGIFHDLINPLTALMTSMEYIKKSQNPDCAEIIKKSIQNASEAGEKMHDFIQCIRKQIHDEDESVEVFSIENEIRDAIDILKHKANSTSAKIQHDQMQHICIYGSKIKFHQVIVNLISNALDSYEPTDTKEKLVIVSCTLNSDAACITVTDFGCGIPESQINRIFDSFFTTKKNRGGMGIGLSCTKEFIEKHFKGKISVKSTPGSGTTFVVTIPLISQRHETI